MDQTAVKPGLPPQGPQTGIQELPDSAPRPTRAPKPMPLRILEAMADLRITVTLFVLAMLIVFWGTLAQVDNGVWTIVQKYFRSVFVWVPLKVVFFNGIENSTAAIPFPGGWLIGGAMFVNLLAAHAVRFKLTWNRAGILLIHAGIIVMMVGELITGIYAVEGRMPIKIGQTTSEVIHDTESELAIARVIDEKKDEVITVPGRKLRYQRVIDSPDVPFKIEVEHYMVNSVLLNKPGIHLAKKGFGKQHLAKNVPEASGVDQEQRVDMPSVYVHLVDRKGNDLETWLFSTWLDTPQRIKIDDKEYLVTLRFKQKTRDFTLRLDRFDHKLFPGTEKPKDFRSFVHISDPADGVERDVQIFMNSPLYYKGETFYQSSWTTDIMTGKADGTVLQVVRNPGWLLPYVSCGVVGIGLLIHFGLTLYRFVERRAVA